MSRAPTPERQSERLKLLKIQYRTLKRTGNMFAANAVGKEITRIERLIAEQRTEDEQVPASFKAAPVEKIHNPTEIKGELLECHNEGHPATSSLIRRTLHCISQLEQALTPAGAHKLPDLETSGGVMREVPQPNVVGVAVVAEKTASEIYGAQPTASVGAVGCANRIAANLQQIVHVFMVGEEVQEAITIPVQQAIDAAVARACAAMSRVALELDAEREKEIAALQVTVRGLVDAGNKAREVLKGLRSSLPSARIPCKELGEAITRAAKVTDTQREGESNG
jgi:hypothetical protein